MTGIHPESDGLRREGFTAEDGLLAQALHEVAIPAGLEDRLLASVHAGEVGRVDGRRSSWLRMPRRTWLAVSATVLGAAAVGGYWYPRRLLTEEQILAGTLRTLLRKDWQMTWTSMASLPEGVQLSRHVRSPRGWQYVVTEWDPSTLAFKSTIPGRPPALLFASRPQRRLEALPSRPQVPRPRSGDWRHIAVWREADVLYVLATQGTVDDFRAVAATGGVA